MTKSSKQGISADGGHNRTVEPGSVRRRRKLMPWLVGILAVVIFLLLAH